MVSVLGLVCALVGAVALGSGLFVYSQPAADRGFQRSPTEYAHNAAFAVVGTTLLAVGFFLQALPYMGISHYTRHWVTAVFALVALVVVSGIAFVAYGLLYIAFHAVEARRFAAEYPSIPYDARRRRKGVRFWTQEPSTPPDDAPTEPGPVASP
jgi:drug/metabolite transporter (DMT)-like permease